MPPRSYSRWMLAILAAVVLISFPLSVYASAFATLYSELSPSENSLDGTELLISLEGETFADAALDAANFTLNNAPSGVTVASAVYDSGTEAVLTLAFDGTDFDEDAPDFSVTIEGAELAGGEPVTTNALPIAAVQEDGGTFEVDSEADAADAEPGDGVCADAGGECTLRAAIQEANATEAHDTIVLPAGTYALSLAGAGEDEAVSGDLDVLQPLTIEGAGAETVVIDGLGLDRVFDVQAQAFHLSGVTVKGGSSGESPQEQRNKGGGIYFAAGGTFSIADAVIEGNASPASGGGIYLEDGELALSQVSFETNFAQYEGGGIYINYGTLTADQTTFSGNTASVYDGAGLYNLSGDVRLTQAAFAGNAAGDWGGAIYNRGSLSVADAEFESNEAANRGGGLYNDGLAELGDVTFIGNTAGSNGGGVHSTGWLRLSEALIENNEAGNEGGGLYVSREYSYIEQVFEGQQPEGEGGFAADVEAATFAGNIAGAAGGGAAADSYAEAKFTNVTFAHNSAGYEGGGVYAEGRLFLFHNTIGGNILAGESDEERELLGSELYAGERPDGCEFEECEDVRPPALILIANSIVAGDTGASCFGPIAAHGANIVSDASCAAAEDDRVTVADPLLGELSEYGGNAKWFPLTAGSPAIDAAGDDAELTSVLESAGISYPAFDQRGVARPQGLRSDIGSYEAILETATTASAFFDPEERMIRVLFDTPLVIGEYLDTENFTVTRDQDAQTPVLSIAGVGFGADGKSVELFLDESPAGSDTLVLEIASGALEFQGAGMQVPAVLNVWMPGQLAELLEPEQDRVNIQDIVQALQDGSVEAQFGALSADPRLIRILLTLIEPEAVTVGEA